MIEKLNKIISDIWLKEVKDKFLIVTITYERQMQGEIYHVLKEKLGYQFEIWIEPVIDLKEHNINKKSPIM